MATIRDLKIDPSTGDLVIENGDLVFVEGLSAIAQAVRSRLRLFRGEWFADLDAGVPWFQAILLKNPNLTEVRDTLRQTILGTVGIASIVAFDLTLDAATRTATLVFSAIADTGELIAFDESFSTEVT